MQNKISNPKQLEIDMFIHAQNKRDRDEAFRTMPPKRRNVRQ